MYESLAKVLTFTHEAFRFGVPHFPARNIIPIRTSAHFIAFDADRISPLYTMTGVTPGSSETNVSREDNFASGEFTLPDELCTTEGDYRAWNKEHPEFPVDKGHSLGSQFARSDDQVQSDVDTLAGVTPESSPVNRHIKGPLESAIKAYSLRQTHSVLVQGPLWHGPAPIHGHLRNGQWIPDAMWITACFTFRKKIRAYAWVMQNTADRQDASLCELPVRVLENQTGLVFWSNVGSSKFQRSLELTSGETWWKAGQPGDDSK